MKGKLAVGILLLFWHAGALAQFSLRPNESHTVAVPVAAGDFARFSAQGDRATLSLRLIGGGKTSSLGGTGGVAALSAYFSESGTAELEVLRTDKAGRAAEIRFAVADRRAASVDDIAEVKRYGGEPAASVELARVRALFAGGKYSEALDVIQAMGENSDLRLTAQLHYWTGLCRILLEQNKEAVPELEEALRLQREVRQPYETAATLHNLAAAHLVLGECRDSLQEAEEALAIRSTLGDLAREAVSRLAVAKAHVCAGQAQPALDSYNALIPIFRGLKDWRNEASAWNDLGILYAALGSYRESAGAYRSALRLRAAGQDPHGRGETLVNRGGLFLLTKEYRAALADFEAALVIPAGMESQRRTGFALEGKAEALYLLHRRGQVEALLRESISTLQKVGDRTGEAQSWWMLGKARRSAEDFRRAVALAREEGDGTSEAVYLTGLARLERRGGAELERALALVESARAGLKNPQLRINFLNARREAYELAIEVGDQKAGFAASERAHARALLDEMGAGAVTEVAGIAAIRREALDAHTQLVEYFLGEEQSWGWLISQGGFTSFLLPGRAVLERQALRFNRVITARDAGSAGELAERRGRRIREADAELERVSAQLRKVLLGAVLPRLGRDRLLVVDDGALRLVPFAALGVSNEVVLVPSASVLVRERQAGLRADNTRLLILADPVFSGYPRLAQSEKEANAIAGLLPASGVDMKVGENASVGALRVGSRYGAIHVATHTVLDSKLPELSGIVLSGDEILRLREIYGLRLRTGLVTLSACESGVGKAVGGEGMMGLSHAFLYAGAQRVVASLWKVDDAATALLMESFYRGIYQQHLTPATALHQAQIGMRRDARWAHPYYWASFVMEGEWR